MTRLPIEDAIPDLLAALQAQGRAVLQAPPGAGKTTRVPLALLDHVPGRIVMLEPRRLAARAAAERMAETLGEPVGRTVGYRVRGEAKVSGVTRIEVVTEGILTRILQSDPELTGIGAVIFDEFHERSLNADLGLALTWEVRGALRDDLWLLVMSATLDAAPVAALLDDAPVVTSDGRAFPVETRWLTAPLPRGQRPEAAVSALVEGALSETDGGALVFLPGEGEIRRVAAALEGRLPPGCAIRPLYGAMRFEDQRAAIAPAASGRKVVLATAIAETSLTIEDVRIVIDAGRARRARFDPGTGMSRLVTERVSRAEADQRRGRAGRVAPGVCYRLWTRAEEGALPAHPPAEIESADLTGLALDLAQWGAAPEALAFLTPPAAGAYAEAQALLHDLGALGPSGLITDHGRALAALPLHPRLAHMLIRAGSQAAPLAALLGDRDPLRGAGSDLTLRLRALQGERVGTADPAALRRLRDETRRLERLAPRGGAPLSPGQMAALAYPDRIGLRRPSDAPRWLLSGGRGAEAAADDPLAGQRLIVAPDLDGGGLEARVRLAAALSEAELRAVHADRIGWVRFARWSRRERRVEARQVERLGAIALDTRAWTDAPQDALVAAMLDGVRDLGLPWSAPARRLQARADLMRREGAEIADVSDAALTDSAEDWLAPFLNGITTADQLKRLDLTEALRQHLGWDALQQIDRLMPSHFETPLGRRVPIDYAGDHPTIEVRLQEMFGVTEHPVVGPRRLPLRIALLSPAQRPVQVTMDLPGFWDTSYADVRKDMRGRYPRHPWPEDPRAADPTLRANRRS
ncbi:ATP-dependent helicase HrpB [Anianabacter salinae]|uniref:ATP-dependent helicase HrpB n=1 Tax=Anianabacter salinae TaxID=2851023 RepID=UPI00225E1E3C|nr:ATP-dependent helicase HrpB [Anianabacter salinae]MBV0911317.1 ATP-dependent helicase HrpB [Anianabacter salinae]